MLKQLRQDYCFYGRNFFERAFWAIAVYRLGQWADQCRVAPVRWFAGKVYGLIFKFSPFLTGTFLDRRTKIGSKFHIVHSGMIVIHPGAVFGDRCGVMHGVTVGVNMQGGVPRFGDDVFIGCNATVLGEITVGDGARIAANSLVVCDVPAGALAIGVPAKIYPNMAQAHVGPAAAVAARAGQTPAASHNPQPPAGAFRGIRATGATA